jgi:CRP-like cAMP-binding protein
MDTLESLIREHPFVDGLNARFLNLLTDCARNVRFEAGEYLVREGEPANQFYLIRTGKVGLEISAAGRGTTTFQTIRDGEIVGISWLIPPYRWLYDAKAAEPTRAISVDAACLRQKSEENHDLGYEMMKRLVPLLVQRLQRTRLQILDVYGSFV